MGLTGLKRREGRYEHANNVRIKQPKKNRITPSLVWFEIPADNLERAKKFYHGLFGWNISPFPQMQDYLHIDTGGEDASPDGGMMPRKHPEHTITNYILVESVDRSAAKVQELGGSICMPKTAVAEMGYFVICRDTENNTFALWEKDEKAA